MNDFDWDEPNTEEVEVDEETLAGIDRGIEAADQGRYHTSEEVRKLIPEWLSKFASQNPR